MIALLQRVRHARVDVNGVCVAKIGQGLLVFLGVEKNDSDAQAQRLLERVLAYRVFADERERMNLSLRDIDGELLVVPQFTLAAETRKGTRPSFSPAADPGEGEHLFSLFVRHARDHLRSVECGKFGADMQVSLQNDGPVTFWLQVNPPCEPS